MENVSDENVVLQNAAADAKSEIKLVDVQITNEVISLNVMVAFLNLAQRRGVFSIDESSKIWECIKMFQKNNSQ